MPRRVTIVFIWITLGLSVAGRASALQPADTQRIETTLQRLGAAAIDPLTLLREVPTVPEKVDEIGTRHAMAIARAIHTLETSVDTTLAILEGDVLTPLSLARNYRHLGMRRRALRWYDGATTADKKREYTLTLRREISRCTVEIGDSSLVVDAIRENLRLPRPNLAADETAALLEQLFDRPAGPEVITLFESVEKVRGPKSPRLQLTIARFWQDRGSASRAHELYRRLLLVGEAMDLSVAARALRGLADSAIGSGDIPTGVGLYRQYQNYDTGRLSAWSTYRLGQLAVNAGRLDEAAKNFRSICEREGNTPWRDDACTQLSHTRQLLEIEDALRPYGLSINLKRRDAR
jgi:tetratricopeptide (TPR) repeat protein